MKYFISLLVIAVLSQLRAFGQCPATANAGSDKTACANNAPVILNGSVTIATGGQWSSLGNGAFLPNANSLSSTYYPSPSDIGLGAVTIILTSTGNGGCSAATDTMIITINPAPIVYSGPPVICTSGNSVPLNGTVTGASGGKWGVSGSGTFVPNYNTLQATYVFSLADSVAGYVDINLTSTGNGYCGAGSSQTRVYTTTDSCSSYGNVSGNLFNDINENNIKDAGEANDYPAIVKFTSSFGTYYAFGTYSDGRYNTYLPPGNYTVELPSSHFYQQTLPSGPNYYNITVASGSPVTNLDFAYILVPYRDLSVGLGQSGFKRPGFPIRHYIMYGNYGSVVISNASITLDYDANLNYVSSSLAEISNSSNKLTWNIGTLAPWQYGTIIVDFNVSSSAILGDSVTSTSSIFPIINDSIPSNNTYVRSTILNGSYDPNEKEVYPAGTGPSNNIYSTDELLYTIQFQNTGTADAVNIDIKDTIETSLDLGTLRTLNSSHYCTASVDTNRVVTWSFKNIQLPDSTSNEAASHGFVQYSIKQNPVNSNGTVIRNKALIYFDFNSPVITNETMNTVSGNSITSTRRINNSELINIYPNPAKNNITLRLSENVKSGIIYFSNLQGEILLEKIIGQSSTNISLPDISPGMYFYRYVSGEKVLNGKLIVE